MIYKHSFIIPDKVVDTNGHVNNVRYIQWMQDAATKHSDASGCSEATVSLGATWVVRSHRIEYLRPAFANEHITVLTWISNFRKVRSLRRYKFVRGSDGIVLAKGETDWVFVDAKSGRPRVIPAEVKGLFKVVSEDQEP